MDVLLYVTSTLLAVTKIALVVLLVVPLCGIILILASVCLHIFLGFTLDKKLQPRNGLLASKPIAQPLSFSTPAAWEAVLTRSQWSIQPPQSFAPLAPTFPMVSASLSEILIMIVRDFILVWYLPISSSFAFPSAVSAMLYKSVEALLARTAKLDLASLLVHKILPKVTTHIEHFCKSEMDLRGAGLERHLTESQELDLLLARRYAALAGSNGKLHSAVENLASNVTKQTEEEHFRRIVDKILPVILPPDAASKGLRIVVREIIACVVLVPAMEMLVDPDFWNRSIDQLAGEAIRQQKLISKVRRILDTNSNSNLKTSKHFSHSENINLRTDHRRFESFLRSISRCDSLLDARRLKNDIMGEIRRTRTLLANHEKEEWINGEKTEDIVAYLDRLYTAKRKVEKRIVMLGGGDDSKLAVHREISPVGAPLHQYSLRDVLSNPNSLSYFMEYMDRRNKSLLVQFWLTVESFKNPLESLDSSESDEDTHKVTRQTSLTIKEDMTMLYELYFSTASSLASLPVSQKHVDVLRAFIVDNAATSTSLAERRVRKSMLRAQKEVEGELEHDFEGFERSDLWFRTLTDLDTKTMVRKGPFSLSARPDSVPGPSKVAEQKRPRFILSSSSRARSTESKGDGLETVSLSVDHLPSRSVSKFDLLISPTVDQEKNSARTPLFDDPKDIALSLRSPSPSSDIGQEDPSIEHMEAIQAALTDIIADDSRLEDSRSRLSTPLQSGRRRLFDKTIDEGPEHEFQDAEETGKHEEKFELAGPGDLQLSYDIDRLAEKITRLQSQDVMLDTLIRKAELTGDAQEFELLNRSKSAMKRELRELTFQKLQYEQQEADNRLIPDRTRVSISNSAISDDDGKSVVRYLIEVQQLNPDSTYSSGWVVARRYNEFFNMHQSLKEKFLAVRNLEFPGKRLVTSLSHSFVDTRRMALEKYLQNLVSIPMVCESVELRAFLSRHAPLNVLPIEPVDKNQPAFPGHTIVRTVYHSVAESIDDMLFGPSMLEVMIQRLTRQAAELAGIVGVSMTDEDLVAQALKSSGKSSPEETLMKLSSSLKTLDGETSISSFSGPICDLILAIFEINKKNNWLRRQAIVIILQQVLGGTIERKLKEAVKTYTGESYLLRFLNIFRDNLWPNGRLKPSAPPRTAEEKAHSREEASRKLSALIPDLAANMIGRSNARRGARRIFTVLQNQRLNQHIIYTAVDEIITALFPDVLHDSGHT